MKKLIIYISEDKKIKRIIHPSHIDRKDQKRPTFYDELAKSLCIDAGDQYFGHKLLEV